MKKSYLRKLALFAGLCACLLQLPAENIFFNGYGRTKLGVLIPGGSVFLQENTFDSRFTWKTDDTTLYANAIIYEENGQSPELNLRELYLQYFGEAFDIRIGKQQVIWGKSDALFITDLVSPKDLSRFLVPDFEELRLAITGLRINVFAGNHQLDFVWLPLFTPGIQPQADSIWAPKMPFPVTPTFQPALMPELNLSSGEYFLRYGWLGSSVDFSLMGGWFWNDTPAFAVVGKTVTPGLGLTAIEVQKEYYRAGALGYALAATIGPLVLKSEGAFHINMRYQGDIMTYPEGYTTKNAIQYSVGTDFPILGFTAGVQFVQDIILNHEAAMVEEKITNMATILLARSFARETVRLEALAYIGFAAPDALIKPQITWKIRDGMELAAGGWFFLGNSGTFGQYSKNNSVFTSAKISF
ncbi:MAG TPA: hypothetical protein DIT55_08360 [Spirochaetaceae bacterium]|nr:hypothetical protein [Spirochaetaceae bacterium]